MLKLVDVSKKSDGLSLVEVIVAIAIGVVLFWNFGVNRLWTYRGL